MRRLAPLAFVVVALSACGGDELEPAAGPTTTMEPTTEPAPPPPEPATTERAAAPAALPGLPAWTAGYRTWTKLTRSPLPPRDPDPHLGTKTVYASKPARGGRFPAGTMIVKEAFRPGKDFIGLIATMRKQKNADPDHNDWVFVEWTRDSKAEPFGELARDDVCWTCHMDAADRDYVFTNR